MLRYLKTLPLPTVSTTPDALGPLVRRAERCLTVQCSGSVFIHQIQGMGLGQAASGRTRSCARQGALVQADKSLNVSIRSHGMLGQLPTNEDTNPVQGAGESYLEHTLLVHYLRSLGP